LPCLIVLLAIIVVGPKDLPILLRRFGQFMNKMRGMARDFQGHVDVAMKVAGLEDVQKDLQSLKSGVATAMNPVQSALSGAAASMMDEGRKPATAAPAPSVMTADAAPLMASLPKLSGSNDFDRIFKSSGAGETRVQGRGLDEGRA
jgi:sec-independent protein translocase protein TatB